MSYDMKYFVLGGYKVCVFTAVQNQIVFDSSEMSTQNLLMIAG